ncbi:MAG: hypothetical protein JXQ89_18865 [Pelagimonas sp.]
MTEIPHQDDELDLKELGLLLWSYKFLITVSVLLITSLAVFYAQSRTPQYQAVSIFELQGGSSGPRLPSEYAGLVGLTGLSLGEGNSKGVFDRIEGRDFIARISQDLTLSDDPFFVPEDIEGQGLVERISTFFNLEYEPPKKRADLAQITSVYLDNVEASETPNGSIKIEVTHDDPDRAANVANGIVSRVLSELSEEEKDEQQQQLTYLSDQLANALAETERTKKSVADFALANSLSSQEAFTSRSQLMYDLREDLADTQEMLGAVNTLTEVLGANRNPTADDYQTLRIQSPIVDDVDFRRLLGVPEALDSWEWPPASRLGGFAFTLRDRAARIERSIDKLLLEAERYAVSTENLAALQREANVAEATYNVLIEQVKAQSLASGYQANLAKIYQSAFAPDRPASPNKVMIIAVGVVLGALLGAGGAIILGKSSGRIYSTNVIRETAAAKIDVDLPRLAKFKPNVFARRGDQSSNTLKSQALELLVSIDARSSRVVLLTTSTKGTNPMTLATSIARGLKTPERQIGVLYLGDDINLPADPDEDTEMSSVSRAKLHEIDFLVAKRGQSVAGVLSSGVVDDLITKDGGLFDVLIVVASEEYALAASRGVAKHDPYGILLTRPGRTAKAVLSKLAEIYPLDANVILAR